MRLIKSSYSILSDINPKEIFGLIELAGRTCYKSESKITIDSSKEFIKMILARGHESVIEHKSITIKFICDRGVSHELVRHRLASFSQESTRYCNYSSSKFDNELTFIIPEWLDIEEGIYSYYEYEHRENRELIIWLEAMDIAQSKYNVLIKNGWVPQQARSVLPNSLKTEIVVTANIREWREILRQRTSKAAHPQMRELMVPLLKELQEILPILFLDITY